LCVPEFCPFPLDKASVPSPMALGGGLAHGRSGRVDDGDIKVCDGAIRVGKDEVGEVLGRAPTSESSRLVALGVSIWRSG